MKTTAEMIAVMQAFDRGKKIHVKHNLLCNDWLRCDGPSWNWQSFDYRIAPKKKKRRCRNDK